MLGTMTSALHISSPLIFVIILSRENDSHLTNEETEAQRIKYLWIPVTGSWIRSLMSL